MLLLEERAAVLSYLAAAAIKATKKASKGKASSNAQQQLNDQVASLIEAPKAMALKQSQRLGTQSPLSKKNSSLATI